MIICTLLCLRRQLYRPRIYRSAIINRITIVQTRTLLKTESFIQRWASDGMPLRKEGRYVETIAEQLNAWLGKASGKSESGNVTFNPYSDLLLHGYGRERFWWHSISTAPDRPGHTDHVADPALVRTVQHPRQGWWINP